MLLEVSVFFQSFVLLKSIMIFGHSLGVLDIFLDWVPDKNSQKPYALKLKLEVVTVPLSDLTGRFSFLHQYSKQSNNPNHSKYWQQKLKLRKQLKVLQMEIAHPVKELPE